MSWNNGYNKKKFDKEQNKQAQWFRALGMSEDDIQEIYLCDLKQYRSNRIFAIHNQSIEAMECDGKESRNKLHNKFHISLTCSIDMCECGRFGWIEEIENYSLYCAISKLTAAQKELLTLLYRDQYSQTEVAKMIYHTSVSAVSQRLSRIHNRIIKLMTENGGIYQ